MEAKSCAFSFVKSELVMVKYCEAAGCGLTHKDELVIVKYCEVLVVV